MPQHSNARQEASHTLPMRQENWALPFSFEGFQQFASKEGGASSTHFQERQLANVSAALHSMRKGSHQS